MFDTVTLAFVMVRKASILLYVTSDVLLLFIQIDRRCRCVNSLIDVVFTFALLFWAMLDKFLVERVRDVDHSYSDSFIDSKGFHFDVCPATRDRKNGIGQWTVPVCFLNHREENPF